MQANRLNALRNVSRRFGNAWVVLKGHQTLIGRSSGDVYVNSSGNPYLAQGGSGDVLAGYLAGLLAQPELRADPLKTIRYAVWQHGAAADCLQAARANWVVEDLVEAVGAVKSRCLGEGAEALRRPQFCFLWPRPSVIEHSHGAQIVFNRRFIDWRAAGWGGLRGNF